MLPAAQRTAILTSSKVASNSRCVYISLTIQESTIIITFLG